MNIFKRSSRPASIWYVPGTYSKRQKSYKVFHGEFRVRGIGEKIGFWDDVRGDERRGVGILDQTRDRSAATDIRQGSGGNSPGSTRVCTLLQ